MKRLCSALVLLALMVQTASALVTKQFSTANTPVSVTSTKTTTTFTDNQSNGSGAAFFARWVTVRSCGSNTGTGGGCTAASAQTCFVHLGDANADKTKDIAVEPGDKITIYFPQDKADGITNGWPSATSICAAGETATFRIDAGE